MTAMYQWDSGGSLHALLATVCLFLGQLATGAAPLPVGPVDGSFENGFAGMTVTGEARIVSALGILRPTQGTQAAVLSTAPDAGATPADADAASLLIEGVTIPAGTATLRLDASLLSNEPAPSYANDRFAIVLRNSLSGVETTLAEVDTFAASVPAPWTGYAWQTGLLNLVADVSALAGSPDSFALELRLADLGDGRVDSAVFLDNLRLAGSGLPVARANHEYVQTTVGATFLLSGLASTDDGSIVEYRWTLGDGRVATGPNGLVSYPAEGIFQAALAVTDNDGNADADVFLVQVGPANHAPAIISTPVTTAVAGGRYSYAVVAQDAEAGFGDTLGFSLTEAPPGMAIDPLTGLVSWSPGAGSPPSSTVTIQVRDSLGLTATQTYTLTLVVPQPFILATDDGANVYCATSNGDGTWSGYHRVFTFDGTIRGVAIADFTGDGVMDGVVGVPYGGNTTYYLLVNDGTNHFSVAATGIAATGVTSNQTDMAAGDFNHDGAMDFVSTSDSRMLYLALGNGRGGFSLTATDLGTGNSRGIDAADVDHDGDLDLLRGVGSGGQITLFRGDGLGHFTSAGVVADPGTDPYGVAAADFTGDGHVDLLGVSGSGGDIYLYAGNGSGGFAAGVKVLDIGNHAAFDNLDANGDGRQDLVVANYSGRDLLYYPGNGNGTFGAAVTISTSDTAANVLGIAAPPGVPPAGDPVARIEPSFVTAAPGANVALSGASSTDDGNIASYAWAFGDGAAGTGMDVSHTYPPVEDDFAARLTVTDDTGRNGIATAVVRLLGSPPVADAGGPYVFGEAYANGGVYTVPLDGGGSSDDGVDPLEFAWAPGNGAEEAFSEPRFAPGLWQTSATARIASGEAQLPGTGTWGSAYLVGSLVQARYPGASYTARLTVVRDNDSSDYTIWGLKRDNTNYSRTEFCHGIYFDNGNMKAHEFGTSYGTAVAYTRGTAYDLRLDLKVWGATYYYRVAGAPSWTLLYDSSLYPDSGLRLCVSTYTGMARVDALTLPASMASTAAPTVAYVGRGVHPLGLTATDGVRQSDSDATTVSLVAGALPEARPGGPYLPGEAQANCNQWTVTLDGTGSSDDVGLCRYEWEFGDGATATGATVTHTYAGPGPFTVRLTVVDHALQTHSATTTVTGVPGASPVARPGGPYTVDEGAARDGLWTVAFDGSASSDDVGLCDFAWDFGDGGTGTGPTPSHQYALPGVYTVTLTVRDHALQSHSASTTVSVLQNDPPAANPGGPYYVDEHEAWQGEWTAAFDGSGSTDDFGLWTYAWTFGDGGTGTGVAPVHLYTARGTYIVSLTVTDHGHQTHTVTTQITVAGNALPVANAGGDQTVEVGMPAVLDAGGSTDDFGLMAYSWTYPRESFSVDFAEGARGYDCGVWGADVHATFADGQAVLTAAPGGNFNSCRLMTRYTFPRHTADVYTLGFIPRSSSGTRAFLCGLQDSGVSTTQPRMSYGLYLSGTDHRVTAYAGGASKGAVGTYTDGVTYEVRFEITAGGAIFSWRQAGETAWTLLYTAIVAPAGPFRLVAATNGGEWGVTAMSGPAPNDVGPYPTRQAQALFTTPGTYTASLTVQDHALQTGSDTASITVDRGTPPFAEAGGPYLTNEHVPTRLNGRASQDDFGIEWFEWDFGDGQSQLTRNPWVDHRYATAGS
jgi:PKD repeat protein